MKNTTRAPSPRVPFEKITRFVLGPHYGLSLVICSDKLAQRINHEYRHTSYRPNILSFPLSKIEGEIFLNIRKARREARKYGIPYDERLALLFIHGVLHLKGMRHGRTMETTEQKVLRRFGLAG